MISLEGYAYQKLQQEFAKHEMTLDVKSNHIVIKAPSYLTTEAKIQKIVQSAGYCPLTTKFKLAGQHKFAFSMIPYRLPDFFWPKIHPARVQGVEAAKANYYSIIEIQQLLKDNLFADILEDYTPSYRWKKMNILREGILPALNLCLSDTLSKYHDGCSPIIEIGSGVGYSLTEPLSFKTVRIQPNHAEVTLLSRSIPHPVYQMNVDGLHNALSSGNKKIPLFFALNVFDTMDPEVRRRSISQIAQLQNPGDVTLILLDTNPCIDVTLFQLEKLYPESAIFPYFNNDDCTQMNGIIVPLEILGRKPSINELQELFVMEGELFANRKKSSLQKKLHKLQEENHLKVFAFNEFFVEEIQTDLASAGYQTHVYYKAAFVPSDPPPGLEHTKCDLVYKSNILSQSWALDDPLLLNLLAEKELKIPAIFDEDFLRNLRKKNQIVLGTELLVIEAVLGPVSSLT